MKIGILGGTGFIGSYLSQYLLNQGHEVVIFTRNTNSQSTRNTANHNQLLTLEQWPIPAERTHLDIEAIINLAGETINQRWTREAKDRILHSRVETTRLLVEEIREEKLRPQVLINGSAIGYYGTSLESTFTEDSPNGEDFLAQVTGAWEKEAAKATQLGVRVVLARLGVVLGREGGALPRMVLPYKFFVGGRVGSGKQWISWIHLQDVAGMLTYAIEHDQIVGPMNVTAPQPVHMDEFGQTIGEVINRPHWIPAPSFALRILLGEMSDLVLKGQHVLPQKAINQGYSFHYSNLKNALSDTL